MPELPEVETIRLGLDPHVRGRRITGARVLRDRAVRRQPGGEREFAGRLIDRTITGTGRRGKFLWLSLDDESALLIHLGMSGQLVVPGPESPPSPSRAATILFAASSPRPVTDPRPNLIRPPGQSASTPETLTSGPSQPTPWRRASATSDCGE